MVTNLEESAEIVSAATRLSEMNMALQQITAKFNVIWAAIGPFTITQLQVWEKNIVDMLDDTNIQHLSGLAHLLAQLIRAKSFIEKYEADLAQVKKEIEDGTVSPE